MFFPSLFFVSWVLNFVTKIVHKRRHLRALFLKTSHTMRKKFRHLFGTIICPQWVAVNFPPIFFSSLHIAWAVKLSWQIFLSKAFFYHIEFCFAYVMCEKETCWKLNKFSHCGELFFKKCFFFFSSWRKRLAMLFFPLWKMSWNEKRDEKVYILMDHSVSFRVLFLLRFQFETEICFLSSTSWIYMSF